MPGITPSEKSLGSAHSPLRLIVGRSAALCGVGGLHVGHPRGRGHVRVGVAVHARASARRATGRWRRRRRRAARCRRRSRWAPGARRSRWRAARRACPGSGATSVAITRETTFSRSTDDDRALLLHRVVDQLARRGDEAGGRGDPGVATGAYWSSAAAKACAVQINAAAIGDGERATFRRRRWNGRNAWSRAVRGRCASGCDRHRPRRPGEWSDVAGPPGNASTHEPAGFGPCSSCNVTRRVGSRIVRALARAAAGSRRVARASRRPDVRAPDPAGFPRTSSRLLRPAGTPRRPRPAARPGA